MSCIGAFYSNFILDAFLIVFPILYVKFVEKKRRSLPGEFGLGHNASGMGENALLTIKIFSALLLASLAITSVLQLLGFNDMEGVGNFVRGIAASPAPILAYFLIVRVFAEEFFFRAFLVPRVGVLASSVVFGISHIAYGSATEVIGAVALGWILGYFYEKEKRLLPNFLAHFFYNAAAFIAVIAI